MRRLGQLPQIHLPRPGKADVRSPGEAGRGPGQRAGEERRRQGQGDGPAGCFIRSYAAQQSRELCARRLGISCRLLIMTSLVLLQNDSCSLKRLCGWCRCRMKRPAAGAALERPAASQCMRQQKRSALDPHNHKRLHRLVSSGTPLRIVLGVLP